MIFVVVLSAIIVTTFLYLLCIFSLKLFAWKSTPNVKALAAQAEMLNFWNALIRANYGCLGDEIWQEVRSEFIAIQKVELSAKQIHALRNLLIVYGNACVAQERVNRDIIPDKDCRIEFDEEGGFKVIREQNGKSSRSADK
jgi:hypothetical protein